MEANEFCKWVMPIWAIFAVFFSFFLAIKETSMKKKNLSEIKDTKGSLIEKGVIVGMADPDGNFQNYQGLVINPDFDVNNDGYSVAVFFSTEVPQVLFHCKDLGGSFGFNEWDDKHKKQCPEILFNSDIWKQCPRICFFQPMELVVTNRWYLKHLIERLFHGEYSNWYEKETLVPENHTCQIESCSCLATDLTLINVWGSVCPIYTCRSCFEEHNGTKVDELPDLKRVCELELG